MLRTLDERVYAGDRAVTGIEMDTWNRVVKIRFDSLGYWADEVVDRDLANLTAIVGGALVLTGVDRLW
ncbi:MAG: DUF6258 family protein, partial [Candidatus Methylophosphatis roskildensis]